jgi:dolichol-phosphate mannosyltransferase
VSSPPVLSIIVPVYNEVGTVGAVIDRLLTIDLPCPREIIVVDDGSTDRTREVLAARGPSPHPVQVVRCDRNQGKGAAIRTGLAHARGTIVAIQDADLELDPAQLATLVRPIVNGETEVVYGSRFLSGRPVMPRRTFYANRVLTTLTNLLYGARLTDMETCYKLMSADVARSLGLEASRFDIEPEITAKLLRRGHRILELPIRFEPRSRAQGKKIGWQDAIQAVRTLGRHRLRRSASGGR